MQPWPKFDPMEKCCVGARGSSRRGQNTWPGSAATRVTRCGVPRDFLAAGGGSAAAPPNSRGFAITTPKRAETGGRYGTPFLNTGTQRNYLRISHGVLNSKNTQIFVVCAGSSERLHNYSQTSIPSFFCYLESLRVRMEAVTTGWETLGASLRVLNPNS